MQNSKSAIPQWKPKETKILDERVTLNPLEKDSESDIFRISFRYYKDKLCEVPILHKNIAKKVLEDLKKIGRCCDIQSLKEKNIDTIRVFPVGDYKKLFTQPLSEDTDMKEHKVSGPSRLFYFISGKMFNIVAITNNHYETDKNR